jgi:hypothetical protein
MSEFFKAPGAVGGRATGEARWYGKSVKQLRDPAEYGGIGRHTQFKYRMIQPHKFKLDGPIDPELAQQVVEGFEKAAAYLAQKKHESTWAAAAVARTQFLYANPDIAAALNPAS